MTPTPTNHVATVAINYGINPSAGLNSYMASGTHIETPQNYWEGTMNDTGPVSMSDDSKVNLSLDCPPSPFGRMPNFEPIVEMMKKASAIAYSANVNDADATQYSQIGEETFLSNFTASQGWGRVVPVEKKGNLTTKALCGLPAVIIAVDMPLYNWQEKDQTKTLFGRFPERKEVNMKVLRKLAKTKKMPLFEITMPGEYQPYWDKKKTDTEPEKIVCALTEEQEAANKVALEAVLQWMAKETSSYLAANPDYLAEPTKEQLKQIMKEELQKDKDRKVEAKKRREEQKKLNRENAQKQKAALKTLPPAANANSSAWGKLKSMFSFTPETNVSVAAAS
eukprot:TRINITY_DN1207_c0_g1_i1.p1 TRINITY_DN1207_c0_g1~~TRINITY_DN1207_c0_g1_i1.p1  ORF type:complete len:387 (+),score=105.64 TRINITY_DN1207_c0_g1_i1:153-1163(+)